MKRLAMRSSKRRKTSELGFANILNSEADLVARLPVADLSVKIVVLTAGKAALVENSNRIAKKTNAPASGICFNILKVTVGLKWSITLAGSRIVLCNQNFRRCGHC